MSGHDDFAFEPVPGLPGRLPPGEDLLWQGRPETFALAREAFAINWIAGYMALIVVWRSGGAWADGGPVAALATAIPYAGLAVAGYLVVLLLAWAQARATVYSVTSARVVMRIGAALSVTFQIPYTQVSGAALELKPSGTGTIALTTAPGTRLSYAVLWPHVRPWHMKHTQPALRCIKDAKMVADLVADAAETRLSRPVLSRTDDSAASNAVAAE